MAGGAPAGSGVGGETTIWHEKGGRWTKAGSKAGNGKGKGSPKPEPGPKSGGKPDKAKGNGKKSEAKDPTIVDGFDIAKTYPVDTGGVWTWGKNKKRWYVNGAPRIPKEDMPSPPNSKPPVVQNQGGDETPKVDLQKTLGDLKAYLVQQKIFGDDTSKTEMLISQTQGHIDRDNPPEV